MVAKKLVGMFLKEDSIKMLNANSRLIHKIDCIENIIISELFLVGKDEE